MNSKGDLLETVSEEEPALLKSAGEPARSGSRAMTWAASDPIATGMSA